MCGVHTIGPRAAGCLINGYPPRFSLPPAIDARLSRKPQAAARIEGGRIQIGVVTTWQWKNFNLCAGNVDTHDGVLPAVRDPGCAVRADHNAMRCNAIPEPDVLGLSRGVSAAS